MNFVALALLEACGGDDENAFWILAGMCENLELEVSSFVASLLDAAVSGSRSTLYSVGVPGNGCTVGVLRLVWEGREGGVPEGPHASIPIYLCIFVPAQALRVFRAAAGFCSARWTTIPAHIRLLPPILLRLGFSMNGRVCGVRGSKD